MTLNLSGPGVVTTSVSASTSTAASFSTSLSILSVRLLYLNLRSPFPTVDISFVARLARALLYLITFAFSRPTDLVHPIGELNF